MTNQDYKLSLSAKYDVLTHIDFLSYLTLIEFEFVERGWKVFLDRYKGNQATVDIRYYEISIRDCSEVYFPLNELSIEGSKLTMNKLFEFMATQRRNDTVVQLLDVLTVLSILSCGNLEAKMNSLFQWYNFANTGFMNEMELSILIYRVGYCLRRLKILGSLDLSHDDSVNMALRARAYVENGKMRFKSGLRFEDFYHWIQTSDDCAVFSKLFDIVKKLRLTMSKLSAKVSRIHQLTVNRFNSLDVSYPPGLPLNTSERIRSKIFPIDLYKSFHEVGFCVILQEFNLSEVFVKVERVVDYKNDKFTLSTAFRAIKIIANNHYHAKVVVDNLYDSSVYFMTIYTMNVVYQKIKVSTLSKLKTSDKDSESKVVSILPGTMRLEDIREYVSNQSIKSSMTVMTHPILSMDDVIKKPTVQNASYIKGWVSMLSHRFHNEWILSMIHLFSMTSPMYDNREFCCQSEDKSLVLFPGSYGPWKTTMERRKFHSKYKEFMDQLRFWEQNMQSRIRSLLKESSIYALGTLRMLLVAPVNEDSDLTLLSIRDVIKILDGVDSSIQSSCNHLVILVRSITDLLSISEDAIVDDLNSSIESNDANEKPILTGKYEIHHGEYSAGIQSSHRERSDDGEYFTRVIEKMFDWIRNSPLSPDGMRHDRQITVIITSWSLGKNFEVYSKDKLISIPFCNNLATVDDDDISYDPIHQETIRRNEYILKRIKFGLPMGHYFKELPKTFDRILILKQSTNHRWEVVSKEVAKIHQQRVNLEMDSFEFIGNPMAAKITDRSAVIVVQGKGNADLSCHLYEFPLLASSTTIRSLTVTERDIMKPIQSIHSCCVGRKMVSFRFDKLKPYCNYSALVKQSKPVDSLSSSNIERIAIFRTFPVKSDRHFSAIVSAIDLNSSYECVYTAIQCRNYSSTPRGDTFHVMLDHDMKQQSVISPGFHIISSIFQSSLMRYVSIIGNHCVINLNVHNNIRFMINFIDRLNDQYRSVESILMVSRMPFVPHLKYNQGQKNYELRGLLLENDELNELLTSIFDWKTKNILRDCIIMSFSDIPKLACYHITCFQDREIPMFDVLSEKSHETNSTQTVSQFELFSQNHIIRNKIRNLIFPRVISSSTKEFDRFHSIFPKGKVYLKNIEISVHDSLDYKGNQWIHTDEDVSSSKENSLRNQIIKFDLLREHLGSYQKNPHDNPQYQVIHTSSLVSMKSSSIILGPIVGSVGQTTARILIEFDEYVPKITCRLKPSGDYGSLKEADGYDDKSIATSSSVATVLKEHIFVKDNVEAYTPITFDIDGLSAGVLYKIYFSNYNDTLCYGRFRTLAKSPLYVELAVMGNANFKSMDKEDDNPIHTQVGINNIDEMMGQMKYQQVANIHGNLIRHSILHQTRKKEGELSIYLFHDDDYSVGHVNSYDMWTKLTSYTVKSYFTTSAVFHLGSHSLITKVLKEIISNLLLFGRYCLYKHKAIGFQDPSSDINDNIFLSKKLLSGRNNMTILYYYQYIDYIRSSFRLFLSDPCLRDALASNAHIPIFHSDYVLPVSHLLETDFDNVDYQLISVIRTEYQQCVLDYICRLYDYYPPINKDSLHKGNNKLPDYLKYRNPSNTTGFHSRVWKYDSLSVIVLDNVSNRRSKMSDEISSPFSASFIDQETWNMMKKLSYDTTVTHIIIMSEEPIIPLSYIPIEPSQYDDHNEIIPWEPTQLDLESFFEYWISWILGKTHSSSSEDEDPENHQPKHVNIRNVAIISSYKVPYVTVVQDIRTGMKIQQMCIGNDMNTIPKHSVSNTNPSDDGTRTKQQLYITSGKIGEQFRYYHRFDQLDDFIIDSSPLQSSSNIDSINIFNNSDSKGYGLSRDNGFGVLRIWFDHWKSIGTWKHISIETTDSSNDLLTDNKSKPKKKKKSDAKLTLGPILGLIQIIPHTSYCVMPIMFEIDQTKDIKFSCTNIFSLDSMIFSYSCQENQPFVVEFGPLQLECRYSIQIIEGLSSNSQNDSKYSKFHINTQINWSESNLLFINYDSMDHSSKDNSIDSAHKSNDFIEDIVHRCHIPFHGITSAIHINYYPDFTHSINENHDFALTIVNDLNNCKSAKKPTSNLLKLMDYMIDRFRQEFRNLLLQPSSREIIRLVCNIYVPTSQPLNWYSLTWFSKDYKKTTANNQDTEEIYQYIIALMIARVCQEYLDQLNGLITMTHYMTLDYESIDEKSPDESTTSSSSPRIMMNAPRSQSYYRAIDSSNDNNPVEITDEMLYQTIHKYKSNDYKVKKSSSEAIFFQFLRNLRPCPVSFESTITPNGRVSIELLPKISSKNIHRIESIIKGPSTGSTNTSINSKQQTQHGSSFDTGIRVFILSNDVNDDDSKSDISLSSNVNILLDNKLNYGQLVNDYAMAWINSCHIYRRVCFVNPVPRNSHGSRCYLMNYARDGSTIPLYTIDTIYRSNHHDRMLKKQQLLTNNANNIHQQRREQLIQDEYNSLSQYNQLPDGYLILECRTILLENPKGDKDIISSLHGMILGSLLGGKEEEESIYQMEPTDQNRTRPSPFDYIQLPEWLTKLYPNDTSVFVQDEIYLNLRQSSDIRPMLSYIENNEFINQIMTIYDQSQLSELSRPDDLRQVDMNLPGMINLSLKSIIDQIWKEILPDEVKEMMISMDDEFIRSLVISRGIPNVTLLFSSEAFAKGIQYSFILNLTLKSAYYGYKHSKYQSLLDAPDLATIKARNHLMKDKQILELKKFKSNPENDLDDPRSFVGILQYTDALAKELDEELMKQYNRQNQQENGQDNESDIEDLMQEEEHELWDQLLTVPIDVRQTWLDGIKIKEQEDICAEIINELPPEVQSARIDQVKTIAVTVTRAILRVQEDIVELTMNLSLLQILHENKRKELANKKLHEEMRLMLLKKEENPYDVSDDDSNDSGEIQEMKVQNNQMDHERYADSLAYMNHLLRERITVRRKQGPKITYLSL